MLIPVAVTAKVRKRPDKLRISKNEFAVKRMAVLLLSASYFFLNIYF